jgi:hypothetical protein
MPGADSETTITRPGRDIPPARVIVPARRDQRRPEDDDGDPPRGIWPTIRLLVAAIVIVAVLIFVATRIFNSGGSTPGSHTGTNSTPPAQTTPTGPAPSGITVAVLNGTNTSGLAARAMTVLGVIGFRAGRIANAPSQSHVTSVVGYVDGHRAAAVEVAHDLGLSSSEVGPVHAGALAVAERPGAHTPQVVVTLGSDYTPR